MSMYGSILTGSVAVVGALFGFVVALLQIKQLKLSIEKLEREIRESRQNVYRPTPEEIEKYGKAFEQAAQKSEESYQRYVQISKSLLATVKEQLHTQEGIGDHLRRLSGLSHDVASSIRELTEALDSFGRQRRG